MVGPVANPAEVVLADPTDSCVKLTVLLDDEGLTVTLIVRVVVVLEVVLDK